jgi:hypothetical protein
MTALLLWLARLVHPQLWTRCGTPRLRAGAQLKFVDAQGKEFEGPP